VGDATRNVEQQIAKKAIESLLRLFNRRPKQLRLFQRLSINLNRLLLHPRSKKQALGRNRGENENGTEQFSQAMNRPGEIDNSKLVSAERINGSDEPELQRTLREGEHYTLVPQEVWQRLYERYRNVTIYLSRACIFFTHPVNGFSIYMSLFMQYVISLE
jgi:hypothetical protein